MSVLIISFFLIREKRKVTVDFRWFQYENSTSDLMYITKYRLVGFDIDKYYLAGKSFSFPAHYNIFVLQSCSDLHLLVVVTDTK